MLSPTVTQEVEEVLSMSYSSFSGDDVPGVRTNFQVPPLRTPGAGPGNDRVASPD
jgi:hypothetical protein